MSSTVWTFRQPRAELSVAVHSRLVVNTAEAAIDAALAGIGLTRVLSYQVAQAVKAGALTLVLRRFEPPPTPISIVSTGPRSAPLKLRAFLDFATPRLKARLSVDTPAANVRTAHSPQGS
jgi:DNA-binding transcriptional LysR family regulator